MRNRIIFEKSALDLRNLLEQIKFLGRSWSTEKVCSGSSNQEILKYSIQNAEKRIIREYGLLVSHQRAFTKSVWWLCVEYILTGKK